MTRLIVASDSHGRTKQLEQIYALHPEADRMIFLGDGAGDYETIRSRHPQWPMIGVIGNNDFGSTLPERTELVIGPWRLLLVHGHRFGVRGTLRYLVDEAKQRKCNGVLYGHTHRAFCDKVEGIWVLNPGAVMDYDVPKYAVLDLGEENQFIANLTEFHYT